MTGRKSLGPTAARRRRTAARFLVDAAVVLAAAVLLLFSVTTVTLVRGALLGAAVLTFLVALLMASCIWFARRWLHHHPSLVAQPLRRGWWRISIGFFVVGAGVWALALMVLLSGPTAGPLAGRAGAALQLIIVGGLALFFGQALLRFAFARHPDLERLSRFRQAHRLTLRPFVPLWACATVLCAFYVALLAWVPFGDADGMARTALAWALAGAFIAWSALVWMRTRIVLDDQGLSLVRPLRGSLRVAFDDISEARAFVRTGISRTREFVSLRRQSDGRPVTFRELVWSRFDLRALGRILRLKGVPVEGALPAVDSFPPPDQ